MWPRQFLGFNKYADVSTETTVREAPVYNLHNNVGIQYNFVQIVDGTVTPVGPGQMLEHIVQPPSPFADEEDNQDDTSIGSIVIPVLIALLVLAIIALIAVQRDRRRRIALQRSLVMPRIGQRACVCVTVLLRFY